MKDTKMPTTGFSSNRARDFAVRLNNLINEQKQKGEDIKELKKEAAGEGYSAKHLARAVRELRRHPQERERDREQLEMYLEACDGLDFAE
jgi:uncharacterized protein (UPF0335 family)